MIKVIIESPYRGANLEERRENEEYLRRCIRHATLELEVAPYASHQMMPGALDEDAPEERKAGIECGYAWWDAADVVLFYEDRGWSQGMKAARERCKTLNKPYEVFKIEKENDND